MARTRGRVLAIDGDIAVVRSELYDVRVTNAPRAWKPGDHVELESQRVIRAHGDTPAPGAEVTRMPRKRVDTSRLTALGWRARTALADGLRTAFADFLARPDRLRQR